MAVAIKYGEQTEGDKRQKEVEEDSVIVGRTQGAPNSIPAPEGKPATIYLSAAIIGIGENLINI